MKAQDDLVSEQLRNLLVLFLRGANLCFLAEIPQRALLRGACLVRADVAARESQWQ